MAADGFTTCTLDNLADLRNGKFISPSLYAATGKHLVFGSNGPIARTDELLNPNPVVAIGRVGAFCGSVYRVSEPSWVTDNAIVAEPKTGVDFQFLYYRLKSLDLNQTRIGSAQPLITQSGLKVIRTVRPSLPEQRGIGRVLGVLDDKIELLQQMNNTLEAIVDTIFRKTFLEDAPDSWQTGVLSDLCDRIIEKIGDSSEWANEFLIDLSRMPQRSVALVEWGRGEELTSSVTRFKATDTLFGAIRPYFHKVGVAPVDGVTNVSVFVLRAKRQQDWPFIAALCSKYETVDYATRVSKGTKMPVVAWGDLAAMEVVIPPIDKRDQYYKVGAPLYERIIANILQSRSLAALRDALLPKLMSGEIRAPQS